MRTSPLLTWGQVVSFSSFLPRSTETPTCVLVPWIGNQWIPWLTTCVAHYELSRLGSWCLWVPLDTWPCPPTLWEREEPPSSATCSCCSVHSRRALLSSMGGPASPRPSLLCLSGQSFLSRGFLSMPSTWSHPVFCNQLSGQTSGPKENVFTPLLRCSAAPSVFCVICFIFPVFYMQGSNGTGSVCSLCGSMTPKYKFQTHQAAKEIAAYFWDPVSQPNWCRTRPKTTLTIGLKGKRVGKKLIKDLCQQ